MPTQAAYMCQHTGVAHDTDFCVVRRMQLHSLTSQALSLLFERHLAHSADP